MFASLIKLFTSLKRRIFRTGKSSKETVKEALRVEPTANQALTEPKPFKSKSFSMGNPLPGINLVKANQLAAELEDAEIIRKIRLGK